MHNQPHFLQKGISIYIKNATLQAYIQKSFLHISIMGRCVGIIPACGVGEAGLWADV